MWAFVTQSCINSALSAKQAGDVLASFTLPDVMQTEAETTKNVSFRPDTLLGYAHGKWGQWTGSTLLAQWQKQSFRQNVCNKKLLIWLGKVI